MERQHSIPHVEVPALKFMLSGNSLYVQMNIKSWILKSLDTETLEIYPCFLLEIDLKGIVFSNYYRANNPEIDLAFLHEIEISERKLPTIRLVGDFPIIFHPHFQIKTSGAFGLFWQKIDKIEWVEYKKEGIETDLGSYILRVAHSLKYDAGYIGLDANPDRIGNLEALDFYREKLHKKNYFPTDDTQLPTGKHFEIRQISGNKKFQPVITADHSQSEKLFHIQDTQQRQPKREIKFQIKSCQPPYKPEQKSKPRFQVISQSDFRGEDSDNSHMLFIKEPAFYTISNHIQWGKYTQDNKFEQGGLLLGHTFIDPETNFPYGVVEIAIQGRLAKGSPVSLDITHETWRDMLDQVDRLDIELQIIGWYHTHPNGLDVFMSGADLNIQELFFSNDWQFAIVLNPQKQIWRAFYGKNSRECRGFLISDYKTDQQLLPPAKES